MRARVGVLPVVLLIAATVMVGPIASAQEAPPTLADVAGDWYRHGFVLTIAPDGSATASWRVYQWCTDPAVAGACDRSENSQIINGGQAELAFTSVDLPADPRDWTPSALAPISRQPVFRAVTLPIASGVVLSSTHEARLRVGPIRLVRLHHDTATLVQDDGESTGSDGFLVCKPRPGDAVRPEHRTPEQAEARTYRACGA